MASPQQGDSGRPPPPPPPLPSDDTPASPPSAPDSRVPSFPAPARSSTTASLASTATNRLRSASLKLLDTDLPPSFMAATGGTAARMHSFSEIRRGSLGTGNSPIARNGSNDDQIGSRKFSRTGTGFSALSKGKGSAAEGLKEEEEIRKGAGGGNLAVLGGGEGTELETLRSVTNESTPATGERVGGAGVADVKESTASSASRTVTGETKEAPITEYANGYQAPPKLPWTTSTALALKAYWKWVWTIPGFLITLYGLNVVAWGGMLFLLLCNAAPAMCVPDCNDLYSPRRVWVEIDSQILNALFCVTGFGLVPWRFRDCWWWGVWRFGYGKASWGATRAERRSYGLRRLAGINRSWFRLSGSETLPPTFPDHQDPQNPTKPRKPKRKEEGDEGADQALVKVPTGVDERVLPTPLWKTPDPPPTGVRAPPTQLWKMDFVVWCNMWNTFLQACLAGFMWGLNRFDRPSWSTGLFVALACIVSAVGGLCIFLEGKAVKKVEGVPMESWRKEEKVALDEEEAVGREDRKGGVVKGSELND